MDKEKEISFKESNYEKSFVELFKESEEVTAHVKHIVRVSLSGGFPSPQPSRRGILEVLLG